MIEAGLVDYVAMDIKNSPELYPVTTGILGLDVAPFCESKDILLSGAVDYEFRTTVTAELHTRESIAKAARWISGAKRYFLQNFKDSGDTVGEGMSPCSPDALEEMRLAAEPHVREVKVR